MIQLWSLITTAVSLVFCVINYSEPVHNLHHGVDGGSVYGIDSSVTLLRTFLRRVRVYSHLNKKCSFLQTCFVYALILLSHWR